MIWGINLHIRADEGVSSNGDRSFIGRTVEEDAVFFDRNIVAYDDFFAIVVVKGKCYSGRFRLLGETFF